MTSAAGIGAATQEHGTQRHGRRRRVGRASSTRRAAPGPARRGSTRALVASAARRAAGRAAATIRTGTRSRIARHRTPSPATCARPSGSAQPGHPGQRRPPGVGARRHRALADSTTPLGRPVVPEVSTTTAGSSGSASSARQPVRQARGPASSASAARAPGERPRAPSRVSRVRQAGRDRARDRPCPQRSRGSPATSVPLDGAAGARPALRADARHPATDAADGRREAVEPGPRERRRSPCRGQRRARCGVLGERARRASVCTDQLIAARTR